MVRCQITIQEVVQAGNEVGIAINVLPDNSKGTAMERKLAGCMEMSIQAASNFIMAKAKSGEMIHGEDIEHHCTAMLKRHIGDKL